MGRRPRLDDNSAEENPDAGASEHGKVPHLPTASLKTVPPPAPQTIVLPSAPSYPTSPPPRTGAQRTVPMSSDPSSYGTDQTQPQWSNQQGEGPWGSGPFDEASERPVGLGDPWGQSAPAPGYPGRAATPPVSEGYPGSGFPTDFTDTHTEDARRGMFPTAARPIVTPSPAQPQETYIADPSELHQQAPEAYSRDQAAPHGQYAPTDAHGQPPTPGYPSADYSATQHHPRHGGHHVPPGHVPPTGASTPQPAQAQYAPEPDAASPHMQAHPADGVNAASGFGPEHQAGQFRAGQSAPSDTGHRGPVQPPVGDASVDLRGFDEQGSSAQSAPLNSASQYASGQTPSPTQPGVQPQGFDDSAPSVPGMPAGYPGSHASQPAPESPRSEPQSDAGQPAAVPFGQTQHFGFHPGAEHPGTQPVRGELPAGPSPEGHGGQQNHHSGHNQPNNGQAGHHSGGAYQQTAPGYGPSGMPVAGQPQHPGQMTDPTHQGAAPAAGGHTGTSSGFDFQAQKLPMIAIMCALIIGVLVGTILGVNLRGGDDEAPAASLPQDIGVTETSMPCEAGKSVAFIGAAMPPEAIFTASQTAQEFQAKAQSVGLPPATVKMSSADQVCESALKNYSVPETGKMYVWGGTFDTPELAKEWCEKLGRSDLVKQCIIRTMA